MSRKGEKVVAPKRRCNQIGQTMGPKGVKTRTRLKEATARLLARTPLRELRVSDIARAAKTSSATFYVYFSDVDDAVLAVIGELSQSTPELLRMLEEDWAAGDEIGHARAFVQSYVDFWEAHRAVFHARNLAADEGDGRFNAARTNSIAPLLDALAKRIAQSQDAGRLPENLHPVAAAGAVVALLERFSAVAPTSNSPERGVSTARLLDAAAFLLAAALEGDRVFLSAAETRKKERGGA